MRKQALVGGLAGVASLAIVGLIWSGLVPSPIDHSHGAIGACLDKTKEQLRSPSSFQLVWSEYTARGPMTTEERKQAFQSQTVQNDTGDKILHAYMRAIEVRGPKLAQRLRRGEKLTGVDADLARSWIQGEEAEKANTIRVAKNLPEDQTAFVTLEYDADNGFGASIRNFGICRFGAIGSDGRFAKSDIIMSGPIDAAVGQQTKDLTERSRSQ